MTSLAKVNRTGPFKDILAHVPLDDDLINAKVWSDEGIDTRTHSLAKLAYDKVFVV